MSRPLLLLASIPCVSGHAFMITPASRNYNQCPSIGKDGLPLVKLLNGCLVTQDRSAFFPGACQNLPCSPCLKILPGWIAGNDGKHTCSPGNFPGVVPMTGNVCGDMSAEVFVLPGLDVDFKKDDPQVTWKAGSVVDVQVNYFLNHAGSYQFRLCLDGSDTDDCFTQLPLKFEDGEDWHWIGSNFLPVGVNPWTPLDGMPMKDRIVIPDWVECDRCTLNWRWDTALEASIFSNCADVRIEREYTGFNLATYGGFCLDIPGQNYESGQPLWVWECTNTINQDFIFAEGSWQIASAASSNLCVDAGDMSVGNQIMLWECNSMDQQRFGYDADDGTIYLANSKSDASLCLKPEGDWNSARTVVAQCDDEGSKQWSVTSASARTVAAV